MGLWDTIQEDLKKNLQEGLEIFKEGSSVITKKIEELTEGGKKKYKEFNVSMKLQEEFAKLGGEIYDLINDKSKNPLADKKVVAIIKNIEKLESQITEDEKAVAAPAKKTSSKKKTTAKKKTAVKKKAAPKKKTAAKKKTAVKKKAAVKSKTETGTPPEEQKGQA